MPNISYNLLTIKGPANELTSFYEAFNGHCAYYWIPESAFRPYPMKPMPYFMDLPALKGENCERYNLRMEAELSKMPKTNCFNALHPVPLNVRKNGYSPPMTLGVVGDKEREEYGYFWQNSNWGTKWEMMELVVNEENDKRGQYEFQTAWGCPDQLLAYASTRFPNLRFIISYDNEGGLIGETIYKNGKVILDINETNSNNIRYYIIYAHICGLAKGGKFRGGTLNDYVGEMSGYRSELGWVTTIYHRLKTMDVTADIKGLPFSKELINGYLNDLRLAFGNAAIDIFNEKKKEVETIEKTIDTIRLDIRGSHLKLAV